MRAGKTGRLKLGVRSWKLGGSLWFSFYYESRAGAVVAPALLYL